MAAVAMVLVFGLKWPVLRTLGACALLGLALSVRRLIRDPRESGGQRWR